MRTRPRYERDHSAEQRDCSVYLISVLDWRTDYRSVWERGYVGETAREPFTRFMEHLYDQEFADLIVGKPKILRVCDSKEDALAAEKLEVERLWPQYNYEWQPPDNANRVPIPDQKRMREERDAASAAGTSIHDIGHSNYQLGGKQGYAPRPRRKATEPHPVNPAPQPHRAAKAAPRKVANAVPAPLPVRRRSLASLVVLAVILWLAFVPMLWVGLWWTVDVWRGWPCPPELGAGVSVPVAFLLAHCCARRLA